MPFWPIQGPWYYDNTMHKRNTISTGFTIVELLIVVVVIAILAAITVVAYTNFQNRAYDSAVQSDLAAIAKKLEVARVDLGHYPQSASEFPDGFKFTKSAYDDTRQNVHYCLNRNANQSYAIGVQSKSGTGFLLHNGSITSGVDGGAYPTCALVGTTWNTIDPTYFGRYGINGSGEWRATSIWKWL